MSAQVTQLRTGALTDVGLRRDLNEDDYVVIEPCLDKRTQSVAQTKGNLYVVADGMGGHNAGDVASRLAVDLIRQKYYESESPDVRKTLAWAIQDANRQVFERARDVQSEAGMGATIVAAVIRGDELHVAHAGDSRAYLVRGSRIEQLTVDHSWVNEQLEKGLIRPEEAQDHPQRNYITRSLGYKPELNVDYNRWSIHEGDTLLLCSDGLSGQVDDQRMSQVVSYWEPSDASEELVRLANDAGGPDNITAIVARVEAVVSESPLYRLAPTETLPVVSGESGSKPQRKATRSKPKWQSTQIVTALGALAILVLVLLTAVLAWRNVQLQQQVNDLSETSAAASAVIEGTSTIPQPQESGSTIALTTQQASTPSLKVITPSLNVRVGPGPEFPEVGQVHENETYALLGQHAGSGWLKICCFGDNSNQAGWVSHDPDLVESNMSLNTLPQIR